MNAGVSATQKVGGNAFIGAASRASASPAYGWGVNDDGELGIGTATGLQRQGCEAPHRYTLSPALTTTPADVKRVPFVVPFLAAKSVIAERKLRPPTPGFPLKADKVTVLNWLSG